MVTLGDAAETRRFRLDIAYVGTRFAGWQTQPGMMTIQGTIEDVLRAVTGEAATVHGSGRTDAGVHARAQVAHVDTRSRLEPVRLRDALNALLPDDVRILAASVVPMTFHARASARAKEYRYRIGRAEVLPPHLAPFALHHAGPLDLTKMQEAAAAFLGEHDFIRFRATGSSAGTTVRTVTAAEWIPADEDCAQGTLTFRIEANGFLYKMARSITGFLIEVGRDRIAPASAAPLLRGEIADVLWPVLPPQGLHLWRVTY